MRSSIDIGNVEKAELHLVSSSFGDKSGIEYDNALLYKIIAQAVDNVAGSNSEEYLELVTGDVTEQIVIRSKLDQAFANLSEGRPIDLVYFQGLSSESYLSKQSSKWEFKVARYKIKLLGGWRESEDALRISNTIRMTMRGDDGAESIQFCDPNHGLSQSVAESLAIVNKVSPLFERDCVSMLKAVAVVKAKFSSAYNNEAPLMCMINEDVFVDKFLLADALVHESLHEKMAGIRVSHFLLREGYYDPTSENSKRILLPWPNCAHNPRPFSTARALATAHYYIHSFVFHAKLIHQFEKIQAVKLYEVEKIRARMLRSYVRAKFLLDNLEVNSVQNELASNGKRFVEWLREVKIILGDRSVESALLPSVDS